jgi:hypothetical protein
MTTTQRKIEAGTKILTNYHFGRRGEFKPATVLAVDSEQDTLTVAWDGQKCTPFTISRYELFEVCDTVVDGEASVWTAGEWLVNLCSDAVVVK